MQIKSDAQLLGEYATQRSETAFAEIVGRHTDLVYSAAFRQTGSTELAREIAQSVFTDLARKAGDLASAMSADASLAGWLFRGTRLAGLKLLRDDHRRQTRERQFMEHFNPGSETVPEWERVAPVLDEAMAELGDADHEAVLLRYFKNQDFRAVGLALGVSDAAAQKRVSRAVEHLREFFAKRGVTVGASGLVVVLSANAVQAAPAGLAGTISTAAVLAGTTLATAATATAIAGKAIAMTTLQKTFTAAALLLALSLGVFLTSAWLFWPSRPARTANPAAASGWVQLGKEVALHGLVPANQQHDGVTEPSLMGNIECHSLQRYPGRPELYAYFRIDPALKTHLTNLCIIEVEYFDADAGGNFRLDYDSYDESNRSLGAYTQSKERVNLKGTQRWRRARFLLDDARFEGRQNDQADFRVTVVGARFFLRSVKVLQE